MTSSKRAHFLRLTLEEQSAARKSTSTEERKRHEELAIAYEIRCLRDAHSNVEKGVKEVETAGHSAFKDDQP
jgi:hypothetical protein